MKKKEPEGKFKFILEYDKDEFKNKGFLALQKKGFLTGDTFHIGNPVDIKVKNIIRTKNRYTVVFSFSKPNRRM